MSAYYNEKNRFMAEWLRGLISAGLIAPGDVDERDIRDIRPSELKGYRQCHFFAGLGGWSAALRIAGVADEDPWWTASCPCQPLSAAGSRSGFVDERHLWPSFFHLVQECRPGRVIGEQVASQLGLLWSDLVQDDMDGADYACGILDLCAAGIEAPQERQRLTWLAYTENSDWWCEQSEEEPWCRRSRSAGGSAARAMASAYGFQLQHVASAGEQQIREQGLRSSFWDRADWIDCRDGFARPFEPGSFPLAYGLSVGVERSCSKEDRMAVRAARSHRLGTLGGYGNAIVPWPHAEVIRAFLKH